MNSLFKKIKMVSLNLFKDRQFRNPLFLAILFLQSLIFVFGIIFNGCGVAQDFEIRAKLYTSYNTNNGQTYSLIIPPSQSTSMSYLKDHIKGVERDPVLIQNNCKIFYVNRNKDDKGLVPFNLKIDDYNLHMSIVYTVDSIDPYSYFDLDILYGDSKISDSGQVLLPFETANNIIEHTRLDSLDSLIGSTVIDDRDGHDYVVIGIFKDKTKMLDKFVSDNYLIGNFGDFSKNNTNHALAFTTGKSYLENLFFLYRINTYINPPNYNRTTIVSTNGNDFDFGGNVELTNIIYNLEIAKHKSFFGWTFFILFLANNALTAFMFFTRRINKNGLIVIGISFFIYLLSFSFIGYLIDLNIFATLNLHLNMVSGTTIFAISLVTFIVDYCLCVSVDKTKKDSLQSKSLFCEIDI